MHMCVLLQVSTFLHVHLQFLTREQEGLLTSATRPSLFVCVQRRPWTQCDCKHIFWLARTIYLRGIYGICLQGNHQIYGHIRCMYTVYVYGFGQPYIFCVRHAAFFDLSCPAALSCVYCTGAAKYACTATSPALPKTHAPTRQHGQPFAQPARVQATLPLLCARFPLPLSQHACSGNAAHRVASVRGSIAARSQIAGTRGVCMCVFS
jgi:hypothetical protein